MKTRSLLVAGTMIVIGLLMVMGFRPVDTQVTCKFDVSVENQYGDPISRATVFCVENPLNSAVSDSEGRVQGFSVQSGQHVNAKAVGYDIRSDAEAEEATTSTQSMSITLNSSDSGAK